MSHVKNQHIVPEFLLKNFSNNDGTRIWSFDKNAISKNWQNEKNRAISSVPTEEFFYDKTIGEANDSFEYILREIENKVAPIILDLIQSKDLDKLSVDEKDIISEFICYQMFRTKGHLANSEYILEQFYTPIEELTKIKIERKPREFWLENLKRVDEYKVHIRNKTWTLAESNDEFYLSDNPVVFQNITNNRELRGSLGINSVGVEIYLPLSSSLLLAMFCNKTVPKPIPNIKCEPGHVENLNWLQVIRASRFIFSKANNFGLINKMIEEKSL